MNPFATQLARLLPARMLRKAADRRHLMELEERLLRDVGLTREDVARSVPFRPDRRMERR